MKEVDMQEFAIDRSKYDDAVEIVNEFEAPEGLTEELVRQISKDKNEPEWMLKKRLQGLEWFNKTPLPNWGPKEVREKLDLNKIKYYVKPGNKEATKWEDVPEGIRKVAERIGIPEAEKRELGGVGFQFDSQMAYHNLRKELEEQGVIFENMDVAVQKYPELVRKYFMTSCIPVNDHKFIMLHAAVWSGGTFIFIPEGVKVRIPLQAYFRMNARSGGQFEHTLIIADKNSEVAYVEGCSAPVYSENALHAGCVEIHVLEGARVRYMSVENWSKNTFNLNTKRAIVQKNGIIEWLNGNMGCLTGDSKIFTNPKGPISIKSIDAGNKVYSWDEETNSIKGALVKAKIFSGYKKVYRLEAGGRQIEASANHPFLTLVRKKNNPSHKKGFFYREWKPLEQLREGDVVGITKKLPSDGNPYRLPEIKIGKVIDGGNQYSRFKVNTSYLYNKDITIPKETNDDFMWLSGILVGDGYVDTKNNKINIAVHEKEDHREEVCRILKDLFNYKVTEKKERYIIVNSKLLCDLFKEIGLCGTAETKQVPDWIFTLPENQILAFLAGYFDSDGHPAENALTFTSINKEILENIKLLGIQMGFGVSRIFKHRDAGEVEILEMKCNSKDSWRINFNGQRVKNLPSRSELKKNKIKKIITKRNFSRCAGLNFVSKTNEEVGFARIDKIKYTGIKPTFDIEVDGYHNFISNGLIVHNSGVTMLYPCSVLVGENAKSDSLGIAFAGPGQNQDTGSKVIHAAPNTYSTIKAKSISKGGGISTYRGSVMVTKNAKNTKCGVNCDALLIDDNSISNTFPFMKIDTNKVDIAHEASVGKIGDEEIFYLMSRGLSEEQAMQMVVSGFIEPVVKQLPLEYAVELNKLIELEMEGSIG